jgi:hypothetical protein
MEDVGIFYGHSVHFTVLCYILWTFGVVRGNLVSFSPFWYFAPRKIWQPWSNPAVGQKILSRQTPPILLRDKLRKSSVWQFGRCLFLSRLGRQSGAGFATFVLSKELVFGRQIWNAKFSMQIMALFVSQSPPWFGHILFRELFQIFLIKNPVLIIWKAWAARE